MSKGILHRLKSMRWSNGSSRNISLKVICLVVVLSMFLPGYLPFIPSPAASAQTDPPPYGIGDWVVNDNTIVKDKDLVIEGNVFINSGGVLTLDHTNLQLHMPHEYQYSITVNPGGTLYVQDNSSIGTTGRLYILTAAPGSKLRISNTTISGLGAIPLGSSDSIIEHVNITGVQSTESTNGETVVVLAGKTILRNSTIFSAYDTTMDSNGELQLYDNKIHNALSWGVKVETICIEFILPIWMPPWWTSVYCAQPRVLHMANNLVQWSDRGGMIIAGGSVYMYNNTISFSEGAAVEIDGTSQDTLIKDNNMFDDRYGILIGGSPNSNITIVNNNMTKIKFQGLVRLDPSKMNLTWEFRDHPSTIEAQIDVKLPMRVSNGGHLTLRNATLEMYGNSSAPYGITVDNKGILDFDNVTAELMNRSSPGAFIQIKTGGTVHILNSTLDGLGYSWGTQGETAGVYSAGTMTIDNSTVMNGYECLVINGGRTTVRSSHLTNCTDGLRVLSGQIDVFDSVIARMKGLDVKTDVGMVNLYNTTFNHKNYIVVKGPLNILWECDLQTMWENGAPLGNTSFNISESNSNLVVSGKTGPTGLSGKFYLREFTDIGSGKETTTPHAISGRFKQMTNLTYTEIHGNMLLSLFLPDHIPPGLKVITPHDIAVYQQNSTLFVNGTAWDNESGLDRVQWSLDQDLWTDVNGLGKWNFTINLKVGSFEIYIRAMDVAGNIVNVTLLVTIKNTAPYLYILSPSNNFTTKLMTVLVEGATEPGATVTIGGQSLVSVDGTFRMSVPVVEGLNVLVVSVKDLSGNTNSTSVRVIRKTTPPKIIITYPPENYYTNKLQELNIPVTGYTDTGAKLMSQDRLITVNNDGSFSFTYGLKEGMNEIYLLAEDSLGNQNSSVRHVIYDITKPTLNITSPENGLYTNQTNVTILGTTKATTTVTARTLDSMVTTWSGSDGRFEMSMNLSEGTNIIQLMARDRANNTKSLVLTVTRDTVLPVLSVNGVTDGMVTDQKSIIIDGFTEVGAHVKLNGDLLAVGMTGSFGAVLNMTSANNTFVFQATDRAGNVNTSIIHIRLKSPQEPKPTGAAAAMNYLPWIVLVAVVVLVVQWVLLARTSHIKAKKKFDKAAEGEQDAGPDHLTKAPDDTDRMRPRRPRRQAPVVVEQGAPEFEIEYGGEEQARQGGGRR